VFWHFQSRRIPMKSSPAQSGVTADWQLFGCKGDAHKIITFSQMFFPFVKPQTAGLSNA
jgi:hypothetical protein